MLVPILVMVTCVLVIYVVGGPIGYGLVAAGVLFLLLTHVSLSEAAQAVVGGVTANYVVLAVPLFIFASYLLNTSGMTDRIFRFAQLLLGPSRGALAQVNVVGTLVFSGMTGSAVADTAGIGTMSVKAMEGAGYPKGFACATTIASAIMGPLLPPSIPLVIYGVLARVDIGSLFVAGIVPAVALAIAHMIQLAVVARRRGFPTERWRGWRVVAAAFVAGLPAIVAPVILIVGIYTGIFTPSESSAVAVLYTLVVGSLVYRSIGWRFFKECLNGAVRQMGAITGMIAGAFVIDYGVTASELPSKVSKAVLGLTREPYLLVLLACLLLLVLGLFLEVIVLEFVVLPILVPIMVAAHVNLVYFGVVFTLVTMIALGMPTLGILNFVLSRLTNTPLREIISEMWKFLALLVGGLVVLVLVPELSLWLPRVLGVGVR